MKQTTLFAGLLALSTAVLACDGRGDDRQALETPPTVYGDENLVPPRPVIAEGCLTASGDRFVLTELAAGAPGPRVAERDGAGPGAEPEPTTQAYRLVGSDDELRGLVGRRVEVTGEAEPEQVVDVRDSSPPLTPGGRQPAGTSGPEPRVATVETARIEINDLHVRSVRATGDTCLGR